MPLTKLDLLEKISQQESNYNNQFRTFLVYFLRQNEQLIDILHDELTSRSKCPILVSDYLDYCKEFVNPHNFKFQPSQVNLYQLLFDQHLSPNIMKFGINQIHQNSVLLKKTPTVSISHIHSLLSNSVDQIRQLFNLNAKKALELHNFYSQQVYESIIILLSQEEVFFTTQIELLKNDQQNELLESNKLHFQRYMRLIVEHLYALLNLLLTRYCIILQYLGDQFQFLFIDLGTRIQIMNFIQYNAFEDLLQQHRELNPYADGVLNISNEVI